MSSGDIARRIIRIVELDLDRCANTYGVLPCTASGPASGSCYNTYANCQAKAAYIKTTHTYRFCDVGSPMPSDGQYVRPYVTQIQQAPTVIDPQAGLATRSATSVTLLDETDSDTEQDPYVLSRTTPAVGSFWSRLLARVSYYSGRFARVKRGLFTPDANGNISYTVNDAGFTTELYIIDSIKGPDQNGQITLTLKDPVKLADRAQVPTATDGTLAVQVLAKDNADTAQAGGASTITLAGSASAVDGTYNGFAVKITGGLGNGQERVISSYIGASRLATVGVAWSVVPDSTSTYEVQTLKATLAGGKGVQYNDPAVTGKQEYICIGEEIIRYTVKSGDVLSWPDTTYRAQFGTTQGDHKATDKVQLCKAWLGATWTSVIQDVLNAAGLSNTCIDTAGFATQEATWLGSKYYVTTCIAQPEQAATLLAELAKQSMAALWWSPKEQLIKYRVLLPLYVANLSTLTDAANIMDRSLAIETLDPQRLTRSAFFYGQRNAAKYKAEPSNYGAGVLFVDTAAEGANAYGDVRSEVTYSRWLSSPANDLAVKSLVGRRVSYYRDAPKRITLQLDPKDDAFNPGDQLYLQTRWLPDMTGAPTPTRMLVSSRVHRGGQIDMQLLTTIFARRYAFIAPAGQPTYPSASAAQRAFAYIAGSGDTMSNGDAPYLII